MCLVQTIAFKQIWQKLKEETISDYYNTATETRHFHKPVGQQRKSISGGQAT